MKIRLIIKLLIGFVIIFSILFIYLFRRPIKLCYSTVENLLSNQQFVKKYIRKNRIVLSLTTTKNRLHYIQNTIKSLLDQTMIPDIIYLNISFDIPHDTKYKYLLYLHEKKIIYINKLERDYGPATKLLPTLLLESDPETVIIYLDDDMIYNKKLIEHLYHYSIIYNDVALCMSGINIDFNNMNKNMNKKNLSHIYLGYTCRPVHIMEGYNGCLVKRKFFPENLTNILEFHNVPKELYYVDDVYISGILSMYNIRKIKVPHLLNLPILISIFEWLNPNKKKTSSEIANKKRSLSQTTNKYKSNDLIGIEHFKYYFLQEQ